MDNYLQVTPFLHVADINAAVRFFTEALGFIAPVHGPNYAYVHRESVGFRLMLLDPKYPEETRYGGFTYYIDVRDVDAVIAEIAPRLPAWPEVHLQGPIDQPYGQREIMLNAPDGRLLVFGQALHPGNSPEGLLTSR